MTTTGLPLIHSHRPVEELIEAHIADRAQRRWKERTVHDRRTDLANLRTAARGLACERLDLTVLERAVNYPGTRGRSDFVRNRIADCLRWGVDKLWVPATVLQLLAAASFTAPEGYRDAPSRRRAARQYGVEGDLYAGGDVPAHHQVAQWAQTAQQFHPQGEALVQVDAICGLRFGELAVLTADPAVAAAGRGNLVADDGKTIRISRQLKDRRGNELPKADVVRRAAVARREMVPTGFDVQDWLTGRAAEAGAEQSAGTNPLALIFPGYRGGYLTHDRYYRTLFLPTMTTLDWPHFEITDKYGKVRRQWRFTGHSLRRRWVVTAVDEWRISLGELKALGGWLDDMTPHRWYHGITDDTATKVIDRLI